MKNKILFIMLAVLLFSSCRKDDIVDTGTAPPVAEVFYEADIIGKIVDQDGNAIEDAIISNAGVEVSTDVNGLFRWEDLKMGANQGTFLEANADGYFQSGYRIYAGGIYDRTIEITLVQKQISGYVSGTSGDVITLAGGLEIDFPENAFTANGGDYTGQVTVHAYHLDPSEEGYLDRSPGDLSGTDETGANYVLESFGMLAVEMETADGQFVQLRDGVEATITVPVDNSLLSDAPVTIPLWHFDDTLHTWVKEGEAELINGNYVGKVSHFSWWNCDVFADAATLCIQIFDGRYQGTLQGIGVELTSSLGTAISITDIEGNTGGLVPSNEIFEITVYDQCGEVIYTGSIGPFTGMDNKEIIPVVLENVDLNAFSGTVYDCETMTVLDDAVVTVFIEGKEYYVATDNNGVYNISLLVCEEGAEYSVRAFSIASATTGNATGTVSDDGINVLDLNLCNDASFLLILDQDGNPIISEQLTVSAKLKANEIIIWGSFAFSGPMIGIGGTITGTFPGAIDQSGISATYNDCTVTLSKVDGNLGGIVAGTIEGTNAINGTAFSGSFVADIVE